MKKFPVEIQKLIKKFKLEPIFSQFLISNVSLIMNPIMDSYDPGNLFHGQKQI